MSETPLDQLQRLRLSWNSRERSLPRRLGRLAATIMAAQHLWISAACLVFALAGVLVWRGEPGFAGHLVPASMQLSASAPTELAANSIATLTEAPPTATASATATPTPEPQPTATLPLPVANVAPVTEPPIQPPPPPPPPPTSTPRPAVRGGTRLALPRGTTVVWGGCASDGTCYSYNFYYAPTRQAVLHEGQGPMKVQHELCHAHQHLSINGGAPLRPSDYDLESWYETAEGRSFKNATGGSPWPWQYGGNQNVLEDFAWTCAYWYVAPAQLLDVSPQRYRWAEANLP